MEFKAFYSETRPQGPQSTSSERRLSVAWFFRQLAQLIFEGKLQISVNSFRSFIEFKSSYTSWTRCQRMPFLENIDYLNYENPESLGGYCRGHT